MQPTLPGRRPPASPGNPSAGDGDGPFDLLDMERCLREDADGRYREQAAAAVEAARHTLKRAVDAGVPPGEYRHLATILRAVEAASEVLATITPGTAGTMPQPPFPNWRNDQCP